MDLTQGDVRCRFRLRYRLWLRDRFWFWFRLWLRFWFRFRFRMVPVSKEPSSEFSDSCLLSLEPSFLSVECDLAEPANCGLNDVCKRGDSNCLEKVENPFCDELLSLVKLLLAIAANVWAF